MFKIRLNLNRLSTFLLYISILILIIAFNFQDHSPRGWYQQFLPDLNGASIVDIIFKDSLTGYAVTNVDDSSKSYILKTTNGGDNWIINLIDTGRNFSRIQFLNNSTGYASTLYGTGTAKFLKTTNGGNNWIKINNPNMFSEYQDISIISENEVWITFDNAFTGGVYRTTNSGLNWENKYPPQLSNGPTKIYMINSRIGFITNGNESSSYLKKTTNAGISWNDISALGGWDDIYFLDSLTGWKCRIGVSNIIKTTNGGDSWINILTAHIGNPNLIIQKFAIIDEAQIWGIYFDSYYTFPNNSIRWVIFKTTDSGLNWGYQLPDTNIRSSYNFINFTDSKHGWCYSSRFNGVHTVTGGNDTTFFVGIKQVPNYIPQNFALGQNYPNPFNPATSIPFELKEAGYVILRVYDITGRLVKELVNGGWSASKYISEFNGTDLSSGIYFYKIEITGNNTNEKFIETKRMILVK